MLLGGGKERDSRVEYDRACSEMQRALEWVQARFGCHASGPIVVSWCDLEAAARLASADYNGEGT